MDTIHTLADRVLDELRNEWSRADPKTAISLTESLGPSDAAVVRRVVSRAGFQGEELEDRVRLVSAQVVTQVQALIDSQPATGAD